MPNYTLNWNTATTTNASHIIKAVITDLVGNQTTTSNTTVTVNNAVVQPVAPTLVAAYAFNEGSGTTTTDISGNNNAGTLNEATWNNVGKYGNSLTFNGTTSHVLVADANILDLSTGMTISAWVNPSSTLTGFRGIAVKEYVYYLYASSSPSNVPLGGFTVGGVNKFIYGASPLPVNIWTHLAITYNGSILRMYVNGVEASNYPATGTIPASVKPLWLGTSNYGEWFPGKLDDIRIYNGALTQADIQSDMNTPLSGSVSTDVALKVAYSFQEGTGTTTADSSGNSHTGTISGATWTGSGKYSNALSFDGVNDYVTTPDANDLDLTNSMTIEAWVNPSSTLTGFKAIAVKEYVYYLYASSGSNVPLAGFAGAGVFGSSALTPNIWTHLATTYDGSTLRLYVNGVNVGNTTFTGAIATSANPLWIGASNFGEFFPGIIDNVRIYNRVLSPAEIVTNMNTAVTYGQDTISPAISSVSSGNLTSASARITWTTDELSDTQVEYGTTTSYGSSSTLNSLLVTSHTVDLLNLADTTTYHYRVKSKDAANNLTISGDNTFSTAAPADVTAPVISGVGTSNITPTTVNISWSTNEASDSQVEYGATTSYENGSTVLNPSLVTSHTVGLSTLTASSLYHYRVKSRDGVGNLATGSDNNFTTIAPPDMVAPTISSVMNSNPTISSTTITWSTNEISTSVVEYGITASYGSTVSSSSLVLSHLVDVTGLTPGTLYHYCVKSMDAANNLATSSDFTFTTAVLPDTTAPIITSLAPSGILPVGTTQVTLSCTTNELAVVRYSSTPNVLYSAMTLNFSNTGGTSHSSIVPTPTSGATYTYYLKSSDSSGNVNTVDSAITFSIPAAPIPPPVSSITITSPNGNENWKIGKEKRIDWTSQAVTSNVNVDLLKGNTSTRLFSNIPNSGVAFWIVTGPKDDHCKIKVIAVSGGISGISTNFFKIT